jgi:hypothetical protein
MAKMRLAFFLLTAIFLIAGCDKISDPPSVPDTTVPGNYTLIWSDEFEQRSTTPDPAKWNLIPAMAETAGATMNGNFIPTIWIT